MFRSSFNNNKNEKKFGHFFAIGKFKVNTLETKKEQFCYFK